MELFCDVLVRVILLIIGWKLAEFIDKGFVSKK